MPKEELDVQAVEKRWVTEGPNSGGMSGWYLFRGFMFAFHLEGPGYDWVRDGIPVGQWIATYGEQHPEIVHDLGERGYST